MTISAEDANTYPTPTHGWVCFHCGEHFPGDLAGQKAAQQHFGGSVDATPGCRLRMRKGEHSLLRRIRWLEGELRELRDRVASEDTDKDRELYAMRADHSQALIREEENGYARGVGDAQNEARGSPTVVDPNRPYCKADQSCCDFTCWELRSRRPAPSPEGQNAAHH